MVKNLSGGKRAKAASRKGVAPAAQNTRVAEDGEMYAVVTKFWGNGLVEVKCADGQQRKCVIRKKFRGRRQRDNQVVLNGAVLVGVRDYESNKETCDLLETYSAADVERLNDPSLKVLFPDYEPGEPLESAPAFIENEGEAVAFDDI